MKRNTLAEVARLAGVNSSTVSRALNPKTAHLISCEQREKIIALCNQLNYRPKNVARGCATGKSYSVGYISGRLAIDMDSPFFSNYIACLCNELQRNGYSLTMISVDPGEDDYQSSVRDILLSDRADGYIVGSVLLEKQIMDMFCNTGRPIVTTSWNQHIEAENVSGVELDTSEAYAQIWKCMSGELLKQKFCFVGTHTKSCSGKLGIIQKTAPEGVDVDVLPLIPQMRYFELNYSHARRYFEEFKDLLQYKVFWCASDLIASALCDVLRARGVTPGVDVMVIGYDNLSAVIPDFQESLTTIDPGWNGLGKTVAGLILKQIDKKEPSPEILKIKARVVSGKSFPLPENIQCSF